MISRILFIMQKIAKAIAIVKRSYSDKNVINNELIIYAY